MRDGRAAVHRRCPAGDRMKTAAVVPIARWRRSALCAIETSGAPELWTSDRKPRGIVAEELRQICSRCPVLAQCAADAVATEAELGTYAGVYVSSRTEKSRWYAAMAQLRKVAAPSGRLEVPA